MDKEKELKVERKYILLGIFAMGFHFAQRNPETGKILFYENPPEINDTGVKKQTLTNSIFVCWMCG